MNTHNDINLPSSSSDGVYKRALKFLKKIFTKEVDKNLQILIESRDDTDIPLSDDEKELIASALKFSNIIADEACVPRSDIVSLSKNDDLDKVVRTFKQSGFSRLPVCGKDLDEVVGFVTLKDIFQYIGENSSFKLQKIMRTCIFVPESFSIPAVLEGMRSNAVQMAIVVDEYGGTTGLITVKDIMEELVGDLDDENEQSSKDGVVELLEGRFQLDARMEIEDLDKAMFNNLGVSLEGEYDTVGGFVLELAGCVPEEGVALELVPGGKLLITKSDGRRIRKVTYIPPIG